ncbi:MAG TPA: DinB family protein [Anaerolineaceae bacterium]|nr:DinB family protein [Anaerolineaceae bacterium]HQH36283.1 DinB family protein [Anaerolineaceae bacterium]HQL40225.1 DinB family protein [Anaerolineaceae bacterium]
MHIRIGLENGDENRSVAWALDFPGCFAYGADSSEALVRVVPAYLAYRSWIRHHGGLPGLPEDRELDVKLVESWNVYWIDEDFEKGPGKPYAVNAWFHEDWKPLTRAEGRRAAALLKWAREDLLAALAGLTAAELDAERPGERWSIRGIARHVANAEWWYLERLGLAGVERAALPEDVLERLAAVRARLLHVLPDLEGLDLVVGRNGEFWSPRKLIRRALWHERDHTDHILKLRG